MTNAVKKGSLALLFSFLMANVLSAQTNAFHINGGFEEGKKGWTGGGATTVTFPAEAAKSGKLGLRIESHEGSPTQMFSVPDISPLVTEAGKKYKLTYWVKPVEMGRGLKFRVYEGSFNSPGGIDLDFSSKKMKANEWQQMSTTFKGNALTKGKISITANLGTYFIDDIQIVEEK